MLDFSVDSIYCKIGRSKKIYGLYGRASKQKFRSGNFVFKKLKVQIDINLYLNIIKFKSIRFT